MPRALRIGLTLTVAALVGGCGGSPLYSEQQVPTMTAPAPSPPTSNAPSQPSESTTSSAPASRSTTKNAPKPSGSPTQPSTGTPKSSSTAPSTTPNTSPPSSSAPSKPPAPAPTSSEPPPEPTPSSPTAPAPPKADPTTLDTLGGPGSGPVGIAGTRYPHSFAVSACTIFSEQPEYEFPLDRRFTRLTGVVGQDDASTARDARLRLKVIGDGRVLADHTVRYGQQVPVSVDVSGVRTLTLDFSEVSCGAEGAALAFGRAQVS